MRSEAAGWAGQTSTAAAEGDKSCGPAPGDCGNRGAVPTGGLRAGVWGVLFQVSVGSVHLLSHVCPSHLGG